MNEDTENPISAVNGPPIRPVSACNRLAKIAYQLACLGPVSLLLTAMIAPHKDIFALPIFEQVFWGVLWFSPSFGILLGFIALGQIRRSARPMAGINYALAGIIVGVLASVAVAGGVLSLHEESKSNRESICLVLCNQNVGYLVQGMQIYAQDYDDHLPLVNPNRGLISVD